MAFPEAVFSPPMAKPLEPLGSSSFKRINPSETANFFELVSDP